MVAISFRTSVQYRFLFVCFFFCLFICNHKTVASVFCKFAKRKKDELPQLQRTLRKDFSECILSLWKYSMGTEHRARAHTPIQCGVSVARQLTCLLHNRAPTPRPNAPDESVHALLHMSYLYTTPKTRLVKNTTPVNYSLRNIPKQRAGAASRAQE